MTNEIKEELRSSPLFNLSLSSKELFHSNFLAWIGTQYPSLFIAVFKHLGCNANWASDVLNMHREHLNLDLCVIKDNGHIPFILENKVKSIPSKRQLERYVDKVKSEPDDDLVLLSLATEFPEKEDIEKEQRWRIFSYKELHDAICEHKDIYVKEAYHMGLIADYCSFIRNLHELSQNWKVGNNSPFIPDAEDDTECKELRMIDLRDKIRYSQLCVMMNRYIEKELEVTVEAGLGIDGIKGEKNFTDTNEVYTNFGFTHGQGLLEAKVKINDSYVLLIQIQGDRYCRGIEWIRKEDATHGEFWNETKDDEFIKKLPFFQFDKAVDFPSVCTDAGEEIKARNRKDGTRSYNKYGNRFLYQSKKIKAEATVRQVTDAVIHDIGMIVREAARR